MKHLIFSDLHGDKVGLKLLESHLEAKRVNNKICLGDIIEFNEDAFDYYSEVQQFADEVILGNHEAVMIDKCDVNVFNPRVHSLIAKTKEYIISNHPSLLSAWAKLPVRTKAGEAFLGHGSFNPENPWKHVRYIEDLEEENEFSPGRISFLAHGHIPFVAWKKNGLWFYERQIYNRVFTLDKEIPYIINSGSILGSREMRWHEKTFLIYEDAEQIIQFFKLGAQ